LRTETNGGYPGFAMRSFTAVTAASLPYSTCLKRDCVPFTPTRLQGWFEKQDIAPYGGGSHSRASFKKGTPR